MFGGVYDLARKVQEGELDTFLTQPKSVLFQALATSSNTNILSAPSMMGLDHEDGIAGSHGTQA